MLDVEAAIPPTSRALVRRVAGRNLWIWYRVDVGPASLIATAAASTVPTYVVGVGNSLANLNQIALGGGTKQAVVVSVGDPAKTQTELAAAIKTIRMSALSCDYKIPSAPAG